MLTAAGGGAAQASHDPNAACRTVVSDLVSLVERFQNSLRLIEQKIEEESTGGGPESAADIIVHDDVYPRYMKAALQACDAHLGAALRPLVDSGEGEPSAASLPALSAAGARPTCSVHRLFGLGRAARLLLGVLASQETDVHLRTVDANELAPPIGETCRGQQQEELLEVETLDRPFHRQRGVGVRDRVELAVPAPGSIDRHETDVIAPAEGDPFRTLAILRHDSPPRHRRDFRYRRCALR